MKNVLIILCVIFVASISFGNTDLFNESKFKYKKLDTVPNITLQSNGVTQIKYRGQLGADSGLVLTYSFPDTSAANVGYIKTIPGTFIRTGNQIWYRNETATQWVEFTSGDNITQNIINYIDSSTVTIINGSGIDSVKFDGYSICVYYPDTVNCFPLWKYIDSGYLSVDSNFYVFTRNGVPVFSLPTLVKTFSPGDNCIIITDSSNGVTYISLNPFCSGSGGYFPTSLIYANPTITDSTLSINQPTIFQRAGVRDTIETTSTYIIHAVATGYSRQTLVYIRSDNVIDTLQGVADTINVIPPALPTDGIAITIVTQIGGQVTTPIPIYPSNFWKLNGNIVASPDTIIQTLNNFGISMGTNGVKKFGISRASDITSSPLTIINNSGTSRKVLDVTYFAGAGFPALTPGGSIFSLAFGSGTPNMLLGSGATQLHGAYFTSSGHIATGQSLFADGLISQIGTVNVGYQQTSLNGAAGYGIGQTFLNSLMLTGIWHPGSNFTDLVTVANYNNQTPDSYSPFQKAIGALAIRFGVGSFQGTGATDTIASLYIPQPINDTSTYATGQTFIGGVFYNPQVTTVNPNHKLFGFWNTKHDNYLNTVSGSTNIGTNVSLPSAILNIVSTTKGVLTPRMTGVLMNAISSPATGLLIYNTDSTAFCYYNGAAWVKVGSGGGGGSTPTLQQVLTAGSTLTTNNTINNGIYKLLFRSNGNTDTAFSFQPGVIYSSYPTVGVSANYQRTAIAAKADSGIAVSGTGTFSGIAGYSTATGGSFQSAGVSGYGNEIWYGGIFGNTSASTNDTKTALVIDRFTGGTAANGIGVSLDFRSQTTGISSAVLSNRLSSVWTTAANATRTSQFNILGVNSASNETYANFQTGGIVRVNNNADTLATKAYARSLGGGGGSQDLQSVLDNGHEANDQEIAQYNTSNANETHLTPNGLQFVNSVGATTLKPNPSVGVGYTSFLYLPIPADASSYTLPITFRTPGGDINANDSGVVNLNYGGSGANAALSNLSSVAINTSLLPGTDNSIALGSASKRWTELHVMGSSIKMYGSSSGVITIGSQAAAGTYNFNLPITAGTSGQVLTSAGGGSSAMTWTTPVTSSNFVYNEQFINSTSSTYTLANTPVVGTLTVYKNSIKLPNSEWSLSGAVVTLTGATLTTDLFSNDYIK